MSTRSISTTHRHDVCDVCERTLLRGEQTEPFVNGGRRYAVCELCKPHALHEGWMREGVIPDYADPAAAPERRRSLFGRRRARTTRATRDDGSGQPQAPYTLDDELSAGSWSRHLPPPSGQGQDRVSPQDRIREPRHVHAIPTNGDHKIAAAADAFNRSEHRRTVAGVGRSLGVPDANLTPDQTHPALVWIVVSWELCWYRYEVDLSESKGSVRLAGQGYELEELAEYERIPNAFADDSGGLAFL